MQAHQRESLSLLYRHFVCTHVEATGDEGYSGGSDANARGQRKRRTKRRRRRNTSGDNDDGSGSGSGNNRGDDAPSDADREGLQGPAAAPTRNPWNSAMRFTEETLSLTSELKAALRSCQDNPVQYMGDGIFLECDTPAWQDSAADAFVSHYNYTMNLERRIVKDTICWLFTMLFFFDVVKHIRPSATGNRIGHLLAR